MNDALELLAQITTTTQPATAPAGPPPPRFFLFLRDYGLLLVMGVLLYFMLFGSKRKQEKQRQTMLNELKKGDEVVTIGGQVGKVMDVRGDRVQLKVDESSNTKIWFLRTAIHRVLEDEKTETK